MMMFGAAITGLRKIVGEFGDWMANGRPPWSDYRVIMLVHLIGLYKCPGVHRVEVGETWRQMLMKCVLVEMGAEAKETCGMEQLCGGLEDGIKGGFTWCISCVRSTPNRRTGGFSSLMRTMRSMRITLQPFCCR